MIISAQAYRVAKPDHRLAALVPVRVSRQWGLRVIIDRGGASTIEPDLLRLRPPPALPRQPNSTDQADISCTIDHLDIK